MLLGGHLFRSQESAERVTNSPAGSRTELSRSRVEAYAILGFWTEVRDGLPECDCLVCDLCRSIGIRAVASIRNRRHGALAQGSVSLAHFEERIQIHGRIGCAPVGIGLQELPDPFPREGRNRPNLRLCLAPVRVKLIERHAPHRVERIGSGRFCRRVGERLEIRRESFGEGGETLRWQVRYRRKVEGVLVRTGGECVEPRPAVCGESGIGGKAKFARKCVLGTFQGVE